VKAIPEKIAAVVFDLDGTLLDTLADLANCMNSVLTAAGHPEHPQAAYKYFVGEGMEMLVRRALPEASSSEPEVAATLAEMRREYGQRWAQTSRPYDDVPQMLDGLSSLGLSLAVLSNKPDDFTQLTVETLLPTWFFAVIRGMRPDTPAKPDPAGAIAVAAALQTNPAHMLYVGDTATDMKTGIGAGMFTIGVTWGFRERDELEANGADRVIDAPSQLVDLATTRYGNS
jgi:phosphoglycolate phosphatase